MWRQQAERLDSCVDQVDAGLLQGLAERGLGPAQLDIEGMISVGVDRENGFNFLPLDVPRHQSSIENAAAINREHNCII